MDILVFSGLRAWRWRAPRLWGAAAAMFFFCASYCAAQAPMIGANGIPTQRYFALFAAMNLGDVKESMRGFAEEARGSIKVSQTRWIDAICYETMTGECCYELGSLEEALDHYTAAVKLYVAYSTWLMRVNFESLRPSSAAKAAPWGVSTRTSRLADVPTNMKIALGEIDNNNQIQRGGVVQQAMYVPINVTEVVRCTTLAISRRAALMGPTAPHDPLFQELATVLSRRPGPPNHWSEAWINLELGVALLAVGKDALGISALQQSLVAGGEFDHPLTCVGLLELGKAALKQGKQDAAAAFFEEATYSAYYYGNVGVLEEAFRLGASTHMMGNRGGVYPPLTIAAQWAKKKDLRLLCSSLLLSAAENYAFLGQTREAAALAEEAKGTLARRSMSAGRLGGRLSYVFSLINFQQGKLAEGDAAIAAALSYMQRGSFWLFHIGLTDALCASGRLSPRVAIDLYREVLRDPQPADWLSDPLEALAALNWPHPVPYDRWFDAALARKDLDAAVEIADRARRHRYFSSQPLGGRLQALRWVLEAPSEQLDKASQLHRQELFTRYPAYKQLAQQARAVRTSLAGVPWQSDNAEQARQIKEGLTQLAGLSVRQEAILREMAVRREPSNMVFPPVRATRELQKSLPKGTAMLVFYATPRQLHAFLLNCDQSAVWQVASPTTVSRSTVALLRDLGQFGQNTEISLKDLADTKWKQAAAQLIEALLKGSKADFSKSFEELVIVPDGGLWYVPFEALPVTVDGKQIPLISHVRVRYAPTASLATAPQRGRSPTEQTGCVVGKLYPRDDANVAAAACEKLAETLPGTVAVHSPLPAPASVCRVLFDRLVVLDDINTLGGPFDWAPASIDRTKIGSPLKDWLCLPWGGPREIVLPGYHTAAEDSLKSTAKSAVPGQEVFLSACGLLSTGARTVLMSRWRTGGQTSLNLVREFAQELPHTSPSDAWQRAVLLAMDSTIQPELEPRLKNTNTDDPPKATNPFFWGGYLLVDQGFMPETPEQPGAPPAEKPKAAAGADGGDGNPPAKGADDAAGKADAAKPFNPGDPNLPEQREETPVKGPAKKTPLTKATPLKKPPKKPAP